MLKSLINLLQFIFEELTLFFIGFFTILQLSNIQKSFLPFTALISLGRYFSDVNLPNGCQSYSLQFFYRENMKKKDNLLEILKKEDRFHLTAFLETQDLYQLSLTSKKYYMQLFPLINEIKLNDEQANKQGKIKTANKKGKNKGNGEPKIEISTGIPEIEVDVDKIPIHKFAKTINLNGINKWKRVEQLDFANDYLNKKIENRTAIFFRNEETNQLIYLNRSYVDPNLNYNKGGFGEDFINNGLYQHIFTEGQVNQQDFSSKEAILKRQKEILEKIEIKKEQNLKNQTISYEDELFKALKIKKIGIILCFGGSFSLGIFENGRCILHKSDKKYVCRKKAGERQFNRDKQTGSSIQSVGSQIRRQNEKKHVINVGQILKQHYKDLAECELIFLQAPGLNRLFIINENENLEGLQDRLRSVCVTAKKANFTEVENLYESISQVNVIKQAEKKEEGKGKQKAKR